VCVFSPEGKKNRPQGRLPLKIGTLFRLEEDLSSEILEGFAALPKAASLFVYWRSIPTCLRPTRGNTWGRREMQQVVENKLLRYILLHFSGEKKENTASLSKVNWRKMLVFPAESSCQMTSFRVVKVKSF